MRYEFVPLNLPVNTFPTWLEVHTARRRVFLKRALRRAGFPVDPEATTPVLVRAYFRFAVKPRPRP